MGDQSREKITGLRILIIIEFKNWKTGFKVKYTEEIFMIEGNK